MLDIPDRIRHVLVVGCARSGTTLLQSIFAAHPSVFSSPETHFFSDSIGQRVERMFRMPATSWRDRQLRTVRRCRVALHITNARSCRRRLIAFVTESGRTDLLEQIPRLPLFIGSAARLYISLGDQIARQQGKSVWLEKTPGHLHYLDTIDRYVPDTKVICVIRSAPDNIASLFDVAKKYPERWLPEYRTIDGCINRWLASARTAANQIGRNNRLFIEYEDLAENPWCIASEVCRFVGMPYIDEMVDSRSDAYLGIVRDREPHKSGVLSKIESRNNTKFKRLFDIEQQKYILSRLGDWPTRLHKLCLRPTKGKCLALALFVNQMFDPFIALC